MSNSNVSLTRKELAEFLPNAKAIRYFEDLILSISNITSILNEVSDNISLLITSSVNAIDAINQQSSAYNPPIAIGSMGEQNANNVNITGGKIISTSLIEAGDANYLFKNNVALTNNAGFNPGTLTNSPIAGNPRLWVAIIINGTTYYLPAF